jgi:3alpha(or 20beta)-hydroxysteroid dehydrogenase
MDRLKNKVALITGAAAGIGAACASLFVQEDANVILTDVKETLGQALAAELGAENACFIKHDVTQLAEWLTVVEQAEKRFGPLNILVNNAGIDTQESVEVFSEADYRKIIAVNQDSVAFGMQTVIGSMRKGGAGAIINISSIKGMAGAQNAFAYVASKYAVRGITKAAALDLAPYNIRVNSVHPGAVQTPLVADVPQEELDQVIQTIPLKRIGQATEISPLVLYLASDESSFSTGSEFIADGGSLAG